MAKKPVKKSAKPSKKKQSSKANQSFWRRTPWKKVFWRGGLIFTALFIAFVIYCDMVIKREFDDNRWQLPAKVYAQPLELMNGKALTPTRLEQELELLGYRKTIKTTRAGDYEQYGDYYYIHVRPFVFWDESQASRQIAFSLRNGRVSQLKDHVLGEPLQMARLDPLLIGQIYPNRLEDRILVKLEQVPEHLIKALIITEDRDFYEHNGVSPKAIARALWHNITSDGGTQGGSTLTQQLVKNYFLTNERSLWRKFREAVMSVLLEVHYEKEEILEAYLNEVYFGQDGPRAIHGVGLASKFFFDKEVENLTPAQSSLLVAILKGPSVYDPRRHPENAMKRRNLVLELMHQANVLSEQELKQEKQTTLSLVRKPSIHLSNVPAFMDLVRHQLQDAYSDQELNSEGLNVFTTLDPVIQMYSERTVEKSIADIEKQRQQEEGTLQAAAIISDSQSGHILAVIGDRKAGFAGYNRAIDARRQIGSVIKPFVMLAALEQNQEYTLSSNISDFPLSLKQRDGSTWQPQNFDRNFHGMVPLYRALSESYNVAMARLGQEVGMQRLADFIERAGVEKEVRPLDALPLGVLELTPLELLQLYQSIASNGLRIKPSSIIAVTDKNGGLLERYPVDSERVASEMNVYLVKAAMQLAVEQGTAKYLHRANPFTSFAGKTGTTNDLKDSWFVGLSGEHLAVVWVGRDDNKDANITGSTAALPVFSEIFSGINTSPIDMGYHDNIEWKLVDYRSGLLATDECQNSVSVPYLRGTAPKATADCQPAVSQQ
ncbi:MAG: penicillin-binding protein 1B [Kangiella sp.]|nr:penicillin-binding protein 1B [Kangiella sp.]